MVGQDSGLIGPHEFEQALSYLHDHPEIEEVLVSGGDPLVMSTDRLQSVLNAIRSVPSIGVIRLATRCPVTLPQRVTTELCEALAKVHPLWVMTHFNHPKEVSPESEIALKMLADHGIAVMNQSVLLAGINDEATILETLFRRLIRLRVRPYYLLQADVMWGTGHFRTPISKGISIMESLQGRLSGIALPKFIVDTPGGKGKVPLGPNYVVEERAHETLLRTFRGEIVGYPR
jgi:lysine 2,3-aminomutase